MNWIFPKILAMSTPFENRTDLPKHVAHSP